MSIVQDYEQVLSKYREMINTILRIEEESINLAYELQKELLRGSQIYAHEEDLKNVYQDIQLKEEITSSISNGHFQLPTISTDGCNLLKETINSITKLLHEIRQEMERYDDKNEDNLKQKL